MTPPSNIFHALLVLFSPHCAEMSPSMRDQRAGKSHLVNCWKRRQNCLTASTVRLDSISTADYCTRPSFQALKAHCDVAGC